MDDILLKTFIEVAESGSVYTAAKKLFISPTAVYKQLHLLEEITGLLLFDHNTRGIVLTKAGNFFLNESKKSLELSKKTLAEAILIQSEMINSKASSSIVVGASLTFPAIFALKELQEFCHKNNLSFMIKDISSEITSPSDIKTILRNRIIDCLCVPLLDEFNNDEFRFMFIGYTSIGLAVPPQNGLFEFEAVSIKELNGYSIMTKSMGFNKAFDQIRNALEENSNIQLIECDHYYSMNDLNKCVENNYALLSYEKWIECYLNLKLVKLNEKFPIPYGFLFLK